MGKILNVGVISCSGMTQSHMLAVKDHEQAHPAAICDVIGKVFMSTGCKRAYTVHSSFYATRGTVVCGNTSPSITLFRAKADNPGQVDTIEIPVDIANHNTFGEFRAFADAVLNDKPVPTDALQGAKTIAACMAIVESARERRTVIPDYDFCK